MSGRRFWTVEQKLGMLRDAFGPGGSVRGAIERHEITSGLLYTWRKRAMSGLLFDRPVAGSMSEAPGLAEVRIIGGEEAQPIQGIEGHQAMLRAPVLAVAPSPPSATSTDTPGRIAIELPSGVRLSVDATVDTEALGRVLSALAR